MEHTPTQSARILVVDPDPDDRAVLRESLEDLPFETCGVGTMREALVRIDEEPPGLVLSELSLPDGSGFSLCRTIRGSDERPDLPIVLVSRWGEEGDRILAFECGADDVIAKPFFARELASRVRAVLRRSARTDSVQPRRSATAAWSLEIEPRNHEVRIGARRVALTAKEFAILETLIDFQGRVLTREVLIDRVWGDERAPGPRSIDVHVKNLRRKLGLPMGAIETVRGVGYRFSEQRAQATPDV